LSNLDFLSYRRKCKKEIKAKREEEKVAVKKQPPLKVHLLNKII